MYVWLLVACLVIGLVLAGWRRANWPRRIAGILAILLTVLSAGSAANATFQYFPTFSRLLGKNANHFLDNTQLKALRDQVAKTGKLPDHGATLAITIPGQSLKFTPRQAYVWVPPAWFAPGHAKLPVIELLHGTPGQPSDWTRAIYADQTSLAYAKKHHGVAPILVMPDINGSLDGDTECANTPMYGQVETYLTQTVPAFMRKEFNASTAPDSMAIAGLSEGGLCSTTLAIRNPKVYVAFGNYSGDESPTYQDEDKAQSIQHLFGGSTALYNSYNPPYLLTQLATPSCPAGSRPAPRTRSCPPRTPCRAWPRTRDQHLHSDTAGCPQLRLLDDVLHRFTAVAVLEAGAHAAAAIRARPVRPRPELTARHHGRRDRLRRLVRPVQRGQRRAAALRRRRPQVEGGGGGGGAAGRPGGTRSTWCASRCGCWAAPAWWARSSFRPSPCTSARCRWCSRSWCSS